MTRNPNRQAGGGADHQCEVRQDHPSSSQGCLRTRGMLESFVNSNDVNHAADVYAGRGTDEIA